ncbi:hypothetical protein [Streptomyces luteireticuli]|uniref:IS5/IS1182 family transposase n=1 Tax=Streptomyces luteireticuli TaxID=173858 RepID=A0ABP3ILI1_9ACTN
MTSYSQVVMVLAWFAKGDAFARLGSHFKVFTGTVWRYVNRAVETVAPLAPTLE